jgi:hypothetical protein
MHYGFFAKTRFGQLQTTPRRGFAWLFFSVPMRQENLFDILAAEQERSDGTASSGGEANDFHEFRAVMGL